ncbi:MAG: hypothetical protein WBF88_12180 [Pusillimonas sp.]
MNSHIERTGPCGAHIRRPGLPARASWLGLMLACLCPHALANLPVPAGMAGLDVPGFEWGPQQTMELSGVPIYVKHFVSDIPVLRAAHALALRSGLFERVLTLNNKVVLSGLDSNWHWLAEIDAIASGSSGYVSALHVGAMDNTDRQDPVEPSFAWLPRQAKRQFDHRNTIAGRQVVQQIYSVALPVQALASYMQSRLHAAGWVPELQLSGIAHSTAWGLDGARLMLFPMQVASGTSLYVHYAE